MLWPNPSSSSLPKAAVDTDSDIIHSSNSDYPPEFINTFDNSRPSSPAPQKFGPLEPTTVSNAPPLRTPPESPTKGYRRDSFRRPSVSSTALFPLQEQPLHRHRPGLKVVPPVASDFSSPPTSPIRSPASSLPPRLSLSLGEHPLFRDCTPSGIELLASRMHIRHYHPQDHIIRRSDQSSAMFYVLRGTVKVVSHDNEATYYEIKENNFFGDVGVLYRVPRSMDVLAKNRCTIAILSGEDLVKALEQSPEMAKAIGYQTQERYQMYLKRRQSISARRTLDGGTGSPDQCKDDPTSENFVKSDVHSAIRKVSLFQSCPAEVIHMLSLHVEPRKYNLGESIIRRGEIGREMFFIVSGVVEILSDDNLRVLARFHEGQFFGEIAVLLDVPRIANVKAVSEVEVFVLTKDNLEAVFKAVPGAAEIITAEGHRLYQNWLANSCAQPIPEEPEQEQVKDLSMSNIGEGFPAGYSRTDDEEPCQPNATMPRIQRRSTDFGRRESVGYAPRSRRMSTSLENLHPIEAGHPAAISVLPLNFTGEFPSGHRIPVPNQPLDAVGPLDFPTTTGMEESIDRGRYDSPDHPLTTQSFFKQDMVMEPTHDNTIDPPTSSNPTIRGLMESTPKRRRASVAVWTQHDLMKLAAIAEQKSTGGPAVTVPAMPSSMSTSINAASIDCETQVPDVIQHRTSSSASLTKAKSLKKLMGPATFQDLEEAIVIQILNTLPLGQLLKARRVCQGWNALIMEHDQILQDLDLLPYKKSVSDVVLISLCNTILNHNKTRTIRVSLRDCFSISDQGLATLAANIPAVQELDLHSCWNVTDAGFRTLGEHCQQLRSVDFSNCRKLGDGTILGLYPKPVPVPVAPQQPLTIEEDIQMTQELMEHLSPAESQDSSDQESDIVSSIRCPVRPVQSVVEGPKGCPLLSKLNLSYCKNLTDKSFVHLSMYGSKNLESLNLQRCTTITPEAFMSLDMNSKCVTAAASMSQNGTHPLEEDPELIDPCFPNLKELYLSDCTFLSDAAIVSLAPHVPRLQDISLSFCCALTDVSIEALSDSCHFLRKMDLSFCGSAVSDASLYRLAQGPEDDVEDEVGVGQCVVRESPLQELEIRGCVRVTELGVRKLLNGCRRLRKLNISCCSGIGAATLVAEEETLQRQRQLEHQLRLLEPQEMDVVMASPQAEPVDMEVDQAQVAQAQAQQLEAQQLPVSPQGTAPHTNFNNPRASGSLAQGTNPSSTELTRKMLALKRGKEWALAQQRPGLEIII
ncbi:hypothetical protein CPC16_005179 [Podila verticillata]|nr:hypothetical protein CPC16_005179 [Podila verticillata]